jgi:hypothetical protein
MKVKLWNAGAAVLAAWVVFVACSPSPGKSVAGESSVTVGPKMSVQVKHNFGTAMQGEVVEHSFKIRNVGDADLQLKGAHGT